jgi:predicted DCC family thiol-disulfide oxidoreductase YuxK
MTHRSPPPAPETRAIVLFDGVCNLCNGAVNFIIERDPDGRFAFAALQSEAGRSLLAAHGRRFDGQPQTIYLVEDGRLYDRSAAALRIARGLRGAWRAAWALILVPRPLRDLAYRLVARNRYRWFGRTEACRRPTPELRARFLESTDGSAIRAPIPVADGPLGEGQAVREDLPRDR